MKGRLFIKYTTHYTTPRPHPHVYIYMGVVAMILNVGGENEGGNSYMYVGQDYI